MFGSRQRRLADLARAGTRPTSKAAGEGARATQTLLLAGQRDALFEHIDSDVSFVLADYQRRRDADRARAAPQEQNAAFEGQFDDAVAFFRTRTLWSSCP